MHDERSIALARMDPRGQDDSATDCYLFGPGGEVGDDDHLAVIASERLAQHGLSDLVLSVRRANLGKELGAIAVGVGVAVGEVDIIRVVGECGLEGKSMVEATSFFLHAVLVVADVLTVSLPADTALIFDLLPRIKKRPHSLVVRTLWLNQVDDIELVCYVFACISHFEVKPLGVIARPIIILENQIILVLPDLHSPTQVTRLKPTFKLQRLIII
jgi:hypothetical protein